MTISTADLDRLEKLEAEATPGTWHHAGAGVITADHITEEYAFASTIDENDANFIAALRNHAPALIAGVREVERMRDDLQAERDGAAILSGYLQKSDAENAKHRARLEAAQKVVEAARTEHQYYIGVPSKGCELCNALATYDRNAK